MSSVESTKNDRAWELLFDKYNIIKKIDENNCFEISSSQINEFREARLMTKFDHSVNLPKLFVDNQLAILPITRGSYIISKMEAYKEFETLDDSIQRVEIPSYIETIDFENITSEAAALNAAYVSNIISDFVCDEEILPTVNGRMSSNVFDFHIMNKETKGYFNVGVVNSQIEIDGGYEGLKYLSIIEAKNFISNDFLIRQLYYPFRLWSNKVSKQVKPIFLVYSNSIFTLYEYRFNDIMKYNSLELIKQKNYSIEMIEINLNEILEVYKKTTTIEEPKIPFPQADNFKRVINLCELLFEGDMSRDEITQNYAFNERQTNYYTSAGQYLGLIGKRSENRVPIYFLTDDGRLLFKLKYRNRQLKLVELVLKHKVFNKVFSLHLSAGEMPNKNEIIKIMKVCDLYNINEDKTYERRASTVSSWVNWILELLR